MNELIYKIETDSQIENKPVVTKEEKGREREISLRIADTNYYM